MNAYVRIPWLLAIPIYILLAGLLIVALVLAAIIWLAAMLINLLLTVAGAWASRRHHV